MCSENNLRVIPSVPVWQNNSSYIFDRKFFDGMLKYCNEWNGTVSCVMWLSDSHLPVFGCVEKQKEELPFNLIVIPKSAEISIEHIAGADIVLAAADSYKQLHISALCKSQGIKSVYIIEYILETRYQIIDVDKISLIRKLRRRFFEWNIERKRLSAFESVDGIQANGAAAYDEYRHFANTLLYFDTRVNKDLLISQKDLEDRLLTLTEKRPLRFAFSGRLISMKGVDHLLEVAIKLKSRKLNFQMSIYGEGELKDDITKTIEKNDLGENVFLKGNVDFYSQLLPDIKSNVDVFLLLHRQSDPSCTYLETLSCGVPIIGYSNKAFKGIIKQADVGWEREIDDISGLVDLIIAVDKNRESIIQKSRNALALSLKHDFESTFQNRIEHLRLITQM